MRREARLSGGGRRDWAMEKPVKREGGPQEPLIEQIFDEMFRTLEERDEFDAVLLDELKDLARRGELRKAAQVTKVIRAAGDHSETA
jgi:hypothetical protein